MSTIIINLLTDDILSRFEIGKMLGEGGFGSVYEGKRLEDGLEVPYSDFITISHYFHFKSFYCILCSLCSAIDML